MTADCDRTEINLGPCNELRDHSRTLHQSDTGNMNDEADGLLSASSIPITRLDPDIDVPKGACIEGTITLIWPYSSATESTALLLVESRSRLARGEKGQVRVQFASHAARKVAPTGIGIGDHIKLSLDGAVWVQSSTTVSTPGRSVDAELRYKRRVALNVCRANCIPRLDVDRCRLKEMVCHSLP